MTPDEREIEFEVLPPERPGSDRDILSALIARVMDSLFYFPGTKFRIGLDPILGLIPGVGDGGTALVSAVILLKAAGAGIPRIVLARMALNILINSVAGAIPVAGDLFSVWFKSNVRNYGLLQKHSRAGGSGSTKQDWLFVGLLIAGMLLLVAGSIFLSVFILVKLVSFLGGATGGKP